MALLPPMRPQPPDDPLQELARPARKQVPGPVAPPPRDDKGGTHNIWYGRRSGVWLPREQRQKARSQYRCDPERDTGRTRGSDAGVRSFCLFFAKGMCYLGPACMHLHRLPTKADEAAAARDPATDAFGRDKHPDGQDQRGGAGAYDRDTTSLYIGYSGAAAYAAEHVRDLIVRDFGAFGPVRDVHVVPSKGIAFVKFHWRTTAEFAREAMDNQKLSGSSMGETLDVRWASEDPNPRAVVGRKRAALDAAEAAAVAAWEALPEEERRARVAAARAARAAQVSDVAAVLAPLPGEGEGEGEQGEQQQQQQQQLGAADASFDALRGFARGERGAPSEMVQALAANAAQHAATWAAYEQQQQEAAAAAAAQRAAQAASARQQQLPPPAKRGAWYEGWRARDRPEAAAAAAAAEAQAAGEGAKSDAEDDEDGGGGALGLLAGYGSGSGSESGGDGDDGGEKDVGE